MARLFPLSWSLDVWTPPPGVPFLLTNSLIFFLFKIQLTTFLSLYPPHTVLPDTLPRPRTGLLTCSLPQGTGLVGRFSEHPLLFVCLHSESVPLSCLPSALKPGEGAFRRSPFGNCPLWEVVETGLELLSLVPLSVQPSRRTWYLPRCRVLSISGPVIVVDELGAFAWARKESNSWRLGPGKTGVAGGTLFSYGENLFYCRGTSKSQCS